MIELTDAELDQIVGGQGTGVGTAATVQEGTEDPVDNARPAITRATTQSGIFPVGHGQITASSAQSG